MRIEATAQLLSRVHCLMLYSPSKVSLLEGGTSTAWEPLNNENIYVPHPRQQCPPHYSYFMPLSLSTLQTYHWGHAVP
jgi:hypothetical protein